MTPISAARHNAEQAYQSLDLPAFAAKHRALLGLVSGLLMFLVGLAFFGQWWVAVVGLVFGIGQWLLWREDGPAHEWGHRFLVRFPPRA